MQIKLPPNERPHIYMHKGAWTIRAFDSVNFFAMQHAVRWCNETNERIAADKNRAALIAAGYMRP